MILGVLSDTHGNLPRAESALRALNALPVDHLIHCGDLGSEEIVTLLFEQQENGIPVTAVVGNVDEWNPDLILYAKKLGLPLSRTARMTLDGIPMAVCHGHNADDMETLLHDPGIRLLFTGHTHVPRDEQLGNIRVLNPGALHRTPVPGYALFNTASPTLHTPVNAPKNAWTRIAI